MSSLKQVVHKTLHRFGWEVRRDMPTGEMEAFFKHIKNIGFRPSGIVDVGANRCAWASLARQYFPDAQYLLIEPQPEMASILESFVKNSPGSHWLGAGAGPQPGELPLTLWDDRSGSSFLPTGDESAHQNKQRITVPIVTLDAACANAGIKPDLVKLDIQGFELEALKGGNSLFGQTELFIVEVSLYPFIKGWPTFAEVVQFFNERDYSVYDFAGRLRRPLDDALGQIDVVFGRNQGPLMKDHRWSHDE